MVPLEKLTANPDNIRSDTGDVSELAASILAQGLLQPLVVTNNGHDDHYVVIAGNRRLAALATIEGMATVACIVHPDMEAAERIEKALVENIQRQALDPIDEAKAYSDLITGFSLSQREAGERVGVDQGTVSKRLALLKLPDAVQKMVRKGTMSTATGVALAKLGDADVITSLTEGGTLVPEDWKIRRAGEQVAANRKLAKLIAAAEKAGVEVYDGGLPTGFRRADKLADVAAAVAAVTDEDHIVMAAIGYDDEPYLYLAERSYTARVDGDDEARAAAVREARRLEREAKAERLAALQALVGKATKTDVANLALAVVARSFTYSTAKTVGELLDLEPFVVEERGPVDHETGEIAMKKRKDWQSTVEAWADQGSRQEVQAAAAVLIGLHAWVGPVRQFLEERGVPDLETYVEEAKAAKEAAVESE